MSMKIPAPGYRIAADMIHNKAPVELSDGHVILQFLTY